MSGLMQINLKSIYIRVFSSPWLYPSLIATDWLFSSVYYLHKYYVDKMMILDTKFLFFFKPSYYAYSYRHDRGFEFSVFVIHFILLMSFLFFSNKSKVSKRVNIHFFIFLFIINFMYRNQNYSGDNYWVKLYTSSNYSPLRDYLKDVEQNFKFNTVKTPFGIFNMQSAYSANNRIINDRVYRNHSDCIVNYEKGYPEKCIVFPFREGINNTYP
ncbi:hypothetical protein [Bacteriovorax stolpii]|uniref:hypothetical protein n=1 Tax=Bacteriovorax stolpii TaxID=960 RepID=UPI0011587BAC|nr:hypothetical protein [Bacteriovorax stolpii]